ncbi:hypothetical protein GCM10007924_06230 [Sneathiella chinensis]|uniref:histidine kinase n=2 Tax=Sneathiella chinensis TaxID=349750 RepID=A0ABQ5TZH9_9PROT|nr:hypothetical protein GCM10007924_06230 [Sneathiella chinensis]
MLQLENKQGQTPTMACILEYVPAICEETRCEDVAEMFRKFEGVHGFAIVRGDRPVGLIARETLTIRLATQFGHAIYAKRPVWELMEEAPLIVELCEDIDAVERMITDGYHHALSSGFIIVQDGAYRGMGTALSLMRKSVERTRIRNAQLEISNERAEHAARVKSQFLANMSHELRTPLNAVIGFSELIVSKAFGEIEPPRYGQYVVDILESGRHLLSMINDILDMSKIEAGRYTVDERQIDLCHVIRTVCKMCGVLASRKGVQIQCDMPAEGPILIGDERAIKQMLLNLVSNGVKYTERGGAVTLRGHSQPDGSVSLEIIDTGIGIPEEELPGIMEPFVQAGNNRTSKDEGTGLGLAIVKALADLHDTRIDMKSAVGVGTTVILTFPAARNFSLRPAA